MVRKVQLLPHDSNWKIMFNREKSIILEQIGEYVLGIEHVGSTAISGVVAKPIIDIAVGIDSLEDAEVIIERLNAVGLIYSNKYEHLLPYRRYFARWNNEIDTVHVHIYEITHSAYIEQVNFAKYLCKYPAKAAEYGDLKHSLQEKFEFDRVKYTEGKDEFIKEIIGLANAEFGTK